MCEAVDRQGGSIRILRWSRVVPVDGVVPWLVVDPDGMPIEPIRQFLVDFVELEHRLSDDFGPAVRRGPATTASLSFNLWMSDGHPDDHG